MDEWFWPSFFIWGIFGIVAGIKWKVPQPNQRAKAFRNVLLMGPIVWVAFVILSVKWWWRGEL
jgi:hypothetical protein